MLFTNASTSSARTCAGISFSASGPRRKRRLASRRCCFAALLNRFADPRFVFSGTVSRTPRLRFWAASRAEARGSRPACRPRRSRTKIPLPRRRPARRTPYWDRYWDRTRDPREARRTTGFAFFCVFCFVRGLVRRLAPRRRSARTVFSHCEPREERVFARPRLIEARNPVRDDRREPLLARARRSKRGNS